MQCSEAGRSEEGRLTQGWEVRRGLSINAHKRRPNYGGNRNGEVR